MAVEDSVAQDQIRAFVERIERLEEEKKAIVEDIKSIYSEARGNGFDVKILRRVVGIRKQDANERMEQEAILELYMSALGMIEAPEEQVYDGERERLNSIAAQLRAAPVKPKVDPLAALRADPALAIVEPAIIESKLQKVQNAQTDPQPSQPAGSDLASLAPHEGQVARNSDIGNPVSNEAPVVVGDSVAARRSPQASLSDVHSAEDTNEPHDGAAQTASAATIQPEAAGDDRSCVSVLGGLAPSLQQQAPREGEAARPLPPIYAEPGVVTWEITPPEGVERHPYSNAFGTLGQDAVVIADDIAKASAQPIVKIGNVILDGWARYMTARGAVGLDGQSTEYPVVQYDGTDPLLDCIRWNIAGRILSDKDKQTVVARLIAIEPKRKAEIIKAVAEMAI